MFISPWRFDHDDVLVGTDYTELRTQRVYIHIYTARVGWPNYIVPSLCLFSYFYIFFFFTPADDVRAAAAPDLSPRLYNTLYRSLRTPRLLYTTPRAVITMIIFYRHVLHILGFLNKSVSHGVFISPPPYSRLICEQRWQWVTVLLEHVENQSSP